MILARLQVFLRPLATALVFASFVHLHIPPARLRHHDEPRTFQQYSCCNEHACNMDIFVQPPSLINKQM